MSDIKLFNLGNGKATELSSRSARVEKDLQNLIESQLETFLGIRFLATEYGTGKTHKGRIDSLGLDENNCPVIIEYKRHSNENVINQGLFYLDWLLDHQAEFRWLVMERLGKEIAELIEWRGTRLICIATDFNKYDEHAVQQINRNIELMRYRYFGDDLLLLELVNSQSASTPQEKSEAAATATSSTADTSAKSSHPGDKTHEERLLESPEPLRKLYEEVCEFAAGLGDEVQRKDLKLYTAFKRIKNFLSIVVLPTARNPRLQMYVKLNPDELGAEFKPITRDVSNIGHWGTGDVEISVRNRDDWVLAQRLVEASYQAN